MVLTTPFDEVENKASLLIVEPQILVPTTTITSSFPCTRNAYLSYNFKKLTTINYKAALGDIIHFIFQQIIETMEFQVSKIDGIIKDAIRSKLLQLYILGVTEQQATNDAKKAVNNIVSWIDSVLKPSKNRQGLCLKQMIASEQEFNSYTYGVKGYIDATILCQSGGKEGLRKEGLATALEIKTGMHRQEYKGQVLLYSLLISERFKNANPENILLYIMDEKLGDATEIV